MFMAEFLDGAEAKLCGSNDLTPDTLSFNDSYGAVHF